MSLSAMRLYAAELSQQSLHKQMNLSLWMVAFCVHTSPCASKFELHVCGKEWEAAKSYGAIFPVSGSITAQRGHARQLQSLIDKGYKDLLAGLQVSTRACMSPLMHVCSHSRIASCSGV